MRNSRHGIPRIHAGEDVKRLFSSELLGVTAADPATFIGESVLLTTAALAQCYIPARFASRVDPMVSL